jgi:hypothetical protein
MTMVNESTTRVERRPVSGLARIVRLLYLLCAALFAVCVVVQVFLAGAGALVGSATGRSIVPLATQLKCFRWRCWL